MELLFDFFLSPIPSFVIGAGLILASIVLKTRRIQFKSMYSAWITGMLWLLHGIYEMRMDAWGKTVSTPIRIDIFLIAPVLLLTFARAISNIRRLLRDNQSSTPH